MQKRLSKHPILIIGPSATSQNLLATQGKVLACYQGQGLLYNTSELFFWSSLPSSDIKMAFYKHGNNPSIPRKFKQYTKLSEQTYSIEVLKPLNSMWQQPLQTWKIYFNCAFKSAGKTTIISNHRRTILGPHNRHSVIRWTHWNIKHDI